MIYNPILEKARRSPVVRSIRQMLKATAYSLLLKTLDGEDVRCSLRSSSLLEIAGGFLFRANPPRRISGFQPTLVDPFFENSNYSGYKLLAQKTTDHSEVMLYLDWAYFLSRAFNFSRLPCLLFFRGKQVEDHLIYAFFLSHESVLIVLGHTLKATDLEREEKRLYRDIQT